MEGTRREINSPPRRDCIPGLHARDPFAPENFSVHWARRTFHPSLNCVQVKIFDALIDKSCSSRNRLAFCYPREETSSPKTLCRRHIVGRKNSQLRSIETSRTQEAVRWPPLCQMCGIYGPSLRLRPNRVLFVTNLHLES